MPRRVWMFWAQGLEDAPPLVRHCVTAWREKNPGWEVRLLSMADLPSLVAMDDVPAPPATSYQAFSDLLRVRLLAAHGGVWADPTCLPVRPLDHWLPPLMQAGFFAFDRPHPERMLASWFLASEPGGVLVEKWAAACGRYLISERRPDDYFWLHYLFEWLVRNDRAVRRAWSRVPKVSADGAHYLKLRLQAGLAIDAAAPAATPMQKLDWRRDYDEADLRRWSREAP
ncbi:MAG TPA: capsular polysaccharide synthesis protein [Caulobacteraceae bacterium]|nr:capsular polysaccharide synthesis protein [Caulobacteraceae bacterium]